MTKNKLVCLIHLQDFLQFFGWFDGHGGGDQTVQLLTEENEVIDLLFIIIVIDHLRHITRHSIQGCAEREAPPAGEERYCIFSFAAWTEKMWRIDSSWYLIRVITSLMSSSIPYICRTGLSCFYRYNGILLMLWLLF